MDRTTNRATPIEIAQLAESLDTTVIDEVVRTGATADEVRQALSEIESELGFDDLCVRSTSTRIAQLRALLAPLVRGQSMHILRGRD